MIRRVGVLGIFGSVLSPYEKDLVLNQLSSDFNHSLLLSALPIEGTRTWVIVFQQQFLWQSKKKMATYFSNLTSQGDVMQTQYLLNSKLTPYQSSDLPHNMMYINPSTTAASHPELFPASSLPAHNYVEAQSVDSREEMLFMAPPGNPVIMQPMDRQLDVAASFSDSNAVVVVDPQAFAKNLLHVQNADLNLQHQGLSLSLGNQVESSVQMPSYHNPYTNSGVSSLMNAQVEHSDDHGSQSVELKKAEYFSFDLAGRSSNSIKIGSLYNHQSSISPKAINSESKLHEGTVVGGMIYNSKYLKAVQELLDEVVNVQQDLKQREKHHEFQSFGHDDASEETKLKSNCQSGMSSDPQKSVAISSDELSPAERNDLQNKMTKLLSMLDEVDRRYKQYYQQMQVVASSFEIMAGCGAARRYTTLALRTISCQFRCLRDAIKKQILVLQQSLGEHCTIPNGQGVGLARLRFVDQQLRQQRNLQQFGVLRQPWRPQRGLPETAVSILRAWLFEHFLHPYPKDSEKIMLARQTGLSRSQVANWFINARVRLWKPMIEEMYKDEFGDVEGDSKSSELAQAVARLKSESEDAGEALHESLMSATAGGGQLRKSKELRTDVNSDLEVNAYTRKLSFQDGSYEENKMNSESNKSWRNEIVNMADESNQTDDRSITAPTKPYDFSMLGGTVGTQVSLALGLQHSETDLGGTQSDVDGTAASMGIDKADYYCIDAINQQDKFSSPHLLSDFVV